MFRGDYMKRLAMYRFRAVQMGTTYNSICRTVRFIQTLYFGRYFSMIVSISFLLFGLRDISNP
jgi:hypothetical protein